MLMLLTSDCDVILSGYWLHWLQHALAHYPLLKFPSYTVSVSLQNKKQMCSKMHCNIQLKIGHGHKESLHKEPV